MNINYMKVASIEEKGKVIVKEAPLTDLKNDEVLIKVKSCGICGSDIHLSHGGFVALPLIFGHEFSGEIVAVGTSCNRVKVGDRVAVDPIIPCNNCENCFSNRHHHCLAVSAIGLHEPGGMAEFCKVKERGVFSIEDLSYDKAAFVEPLCCAIHTINKLKPKLGESILLLGAGPMGIILGWLAKKAGVQVHIIEKNTFRANVAKQLGIGEVFTDISQITKIDYDGAIDATGSSVLINWALGHLRQEGRVVLFGLPDPTKELNINHFHIVRNELKIIGSILSLKNTQAAIKILKSTDFPIESLITDHIRLEEVKDYMDSIVAQDKDIMKVMVHP